MPLFSTLPISDLAGQADSGLVPAFGLVTPQATRVTLTFFGHRFSAAVVPVPLGKGKTVGVYLIWLRVPPSASGYGSSDVNGATGYDAAGRITWRISGNAGYVFRAQRVRSLYAPGVDSRR